MRDPTSAWSRLAALVGPEVVALALVGLVLIGLAAVSLGSLAGNPGA